MKKEIFGTVLFTLIILTSCTQSRNMARSSYTEDGSSSITYQSFYDELSPYGQWINNPEFGYVWSPGATGFRPYYTNGRWAYTNYGWTWVSDYNWGWATFHYGRWFHDNYNGWLWVPGYDWAPAWVSWRQNSNYYGWAPLCPRRRNGSYYKIQNDQWAFVPNRYINNGNLNNYYINNQNNITIINNTTVINKTRIINNGAQYQEGPAVAEVEKVTNAKVRTFAVKQSNVRGDTRLQGGELLIYKPVVKNNANNLNAVNGKPVLTKEQIITDQPQINNGTVNRRVVKNISKNRTTENVTDNKIVTSPAQPSAIIEKQAVIDRGGEQPVKPSDALNTNGALNGNEKNRKEIRNYPRREAINIPKSSVDASNNSNNPATETNENDRINNNLPQKRIRVNQSRNDGNSNTQQRAVNPQNPVVNQGPSATPNPPIERTSRSFNRPQPVPQSSPSNVSPQNTGIKKVRTFR